MSDVYSLVVLRNTATGKPCWVSRTKRSDEKEIIAEILRCSPGKRDLLSEAIARYGEQSFQVETIIRDIPRDQISARRAEAIIQYRTWPPDGYNKRPSQK